MIRKIILFIIIVAVAAWGLQNYTSFKAIDLAKNYYNKFDWSLLQVLKDKADSIFNQEAKVSADKVLNIFIRDGKFVPNNNGIIIGTKVIWTNEDTKPHTVTGENWGSDELFPGEKFSKVFNAAGEYNYRDLVNTGMAGKLIVK
jgi:plastocyanin